MKSLLVTCALLWALPAAAQTSIDLNAANFYWDWTQGAGGPVEQFKIKCGPATGSYTMTTLVAQPTARSFPVKNAIAGAGSYYCVVTAANSTGESPPSGEVFFVAGVTPSSPSNFRVAP